MLRMHERKTREFGGSRCLVSPLDFGAIQLGRSIMRLLSCIYANTIEFTLARPAHREAQHGMPKKPLPNVGGSLRTPDLSKSYRQAKIKTKSCRVISSRLTRATRKEGEKR